MPHDGMKLTVAVVWNRKSLRWVGQFSEEKRLEYRLMTHFLVWLTFRPKRQREVVNKVILARLSTLCCVSFTCLGTVCKVYLQLPLMSLLLVAAAVSYLCWLIRVRLWGIQAIELEKSILVAPAKEKKNADTSLGFGVSFAERWHFRLAIPTFYMIRCCYRQLLIAKGESVG